MGSLQTRTSAPCSHARRFSSRFFHQSMHHRRRAGESRPPLKKYYEDDVAASNPLRAEQAKELDRYILAMSGTMDGSMRCFSPTILRRKRSRHRRCRCARHFAKASATRRRATWPADTATFDKIGEDGIGNLLSRDDSDSAGRSLPRGFISCRKESTGERRSSFRCTARRIAGGRAVSWRGELSRHGARRREAWLRRLRAAASIFRQRFFQ